MDGINILFALENEFDIAIPDDQAKQVRSIREMVEGIQVNLTIAGRRRRNGRRMRRVVITGIGAISALGRNRRILSSLSGAAPESPRSNPELSCCASGTGPKFAANSPATSARSRPIHRPLRAIRGNRRTRGDSGFGDRMGSALRESTGIVTGSCVGGRAPGHRIRQSKRAGPRNPLTIPASWVTRERARSPSSSNHGAFL